MRSRTSDRGQLNVARCWANGHLAGCPRLNPKTSAAFWLPRRFACSGVTSLGWLSHKWRSQSPPIATDGFDWKYQLTGSHWPDSYLYQRMCFDVGTSNGRHWLLNFNYRGVQGPLTVYLNCARGGCIRYQRVCFWLCWKARVECTGYIVVMQSIERPVLFWGSGFQKPQKQHSEMHTYWTRSYRPLSFAANLVAKMFSWIEAN